MGSSCFNHLPKKCFAKNGFRHRLIIAFVSISLALIPPSTPLSPNPVYADTTPANVTLADFDQICGSTLSGSANTATQNLQYCQAAASAKKAGDANSLLWKVWAAVAAVCVAACAASIGAGIGNEYICVGVDIAGSVADGVISHNFMNALMGVAAAGGGLMVNQMTAPEKNPDGTVDEKNKPKDYGACLIAASAAFMAFTNHSSMSSQEKTELANLQSASKVSGATAGQTYNTGSLPSMANSGLTTGAGTTSGGTLSNMSAASTGTPGAYRPGCASTYSPMGMTPGTGGVPMNAGMVMQCATASDSTIPKYVETPGFGDSVKKASGMNLGTFLARAQSPSQAILAGSSAALSPAQSSRMSAALQQAAQQVPIQIASTTYSSGGGGGADGGSGDPSLDSMMAGLMQQFGPKGNDGNDPNKGIKEVIFANQNKAPTAVAEDRTLNIFDRITYRYYYVEPRMLAGGPSP